MRSKGFTLTLHSQEILEDAFLQHATYTFTSCHFLIALADMQIYIQILFLTSF